MTDQQSFLKINTRIRASQIGLINVGVFYVSYRVIGLFLIGLISSYTTKFAVAGMSNPYQWVIAADIIRNCFASVALILACVIAVRIDTSPMTRKWRLGWREADLQSYALALAGIFVLAALYSSVILPSALSIFSAKISTLTFAGFGRVASFVLFAVLIEVMVRGVVFQALLNSTKRSWAYLVGILFGISEAALYSGYQDELWSLILLIVLSNIFLCFLFARSGSLKPTMLASGLLTGLFSVLTTPMPYPT